MKETEVFPKLENNPKNRCDISNNNFFFMGQSSFWSFSSSMQTLPYVGSSSLTRDRTHNPCTGSVRSQPLDTREVPPIVVCGGEKKFFAKWPKSKLLSTIPQESESPSVVSLCDPMLCSLPGPPPGLPNPGMEPRLPALQADSLPAEPPGKPKNTGVDSQSLLQWIF